MTRAQLRQLITEARQGAPFEVCGILAGKAGRVTRVLSGRNVAAHPRVGYLLDAERQLEIMKYLEAAGEEMVGIYHSHPRHAAYPSATDLRLAYYPESAYVIVSLANRRRPVVRAYRIRDGMVSVERLAAARARRAPLRAATPRRAKPRRRLRS